MAQCPMFARVLAWHVAALAHSRTFSISVFNMGIHGLAKLLGDTAPGSIKENEIKNYFGRKVAIDASMSIYQFLIAVRQDGAQLANEQGDITSHLLGIFYRTIRMVEHGIKPVYVFDGKPPSMKSGELEKRKERREEAQQALQKAEDAGDTVEIDKFTRRLVKVTKEHSDECKRLLELMGIPYIEAPTEAEAQCAALVKAGKVFATATEDMDALTFGSNILLRHLTFSEARKMPIREFYLDKILDELGLSHDEFVDLCILLGCDYCDSIRGIGPKRAIELIQKHRRIETVLENLDHKKYQVPDNWMYKEARLLFKEPDIQDSSEIQLKWTLPNEEELVKFLVEQKGFSEDRVRNGSKKLAKARQGITQSRLENFFKPLPSSSSSSPKRKAPEKESGSAKKKKSGSGFKRPK